jgi:hypothetical protein
MKHYLFSERGKNYLLSEYVEKERSTYDIAAENLTYANLVRRALVHHGLYRRDKSQAQKAALKAGRHDHPTQGRSRTPEERQRIGEGVSRARRGNGGAAPS